MPLFRNSRTVHENLAIVTIRSIRLWSMARETSIRVGQVAQMASVETSPGQHKNREIKQELRLIIIVITQKATEVRFK